MKAEIETAVGEIKKSLALLRRHPLFDRAKRVNQTTLNVKDAIGN